ncbi:hypothetical protein IM793_22045 [Pedobacter sp. MR2016-19]|uniref:hypothetical protein n=1 Tax=Pedobacter sp. MR2016-19 TaxID=2780089 RepID=UPI001875D87B|nr:hypothetical protein [Pedobacter sp. MR2016-19]MBE5321854.1 hypothetical protein [Pedobacter sp. MR2016-19]
MRTGRGSVWGLKFFWIAKAYDPWAGSGPAVRLLSHQVLSKEMIYNLTKAQVKPWLSLNKLRLALERMYLIKGKDIYCNN